jgi:hypothetical protein
MKKYIFLSLIFCAITLIAQSQTKVNQSNTNIIDYEDLTTKPIDKLGPGCCQLISLQYGEYKNGYVIQGAKAYNPIMAADCSDVLSTNRSAVFPGRRTILYTDNTNKQNPLIIADTGKINFEIYTNKILSNTIDFVYTTRFSQSVTEEFTKINNGKKIILLTNKYVYSKPLDDFPLYCISYKNGDSSKFFKTNFFGKKRNINSFTVWNSETKATNNYTVIRDKNKYSRFWRFSPLHYYIGLQTPESPNPILNVFAFAGDLITDIIPDSEKFGATKIHFDYTYVKNTNSHLTSMNGTNGTHIVFDYDCNYGKPNKTIPPPPPTTEAEKVVPVDIVKEEIKTINTDAIKNEMPTTRQEILNKILGKWDLKGMYSELSDCNKDGIFEKDIFNRELTICKDDDLIEFFSSDTWIKTDNTVKCNTKGPDKVDEGIWQLSNDNKTIKFKIGLVTVLKVEIEKLTDTEMVLTKILTDDKVGKNICTTKYVYNYIRK